MFFVINKPSGYQTYEEVDIYYILAYFITSKVKIMFICESILIFLGLFMFLLKPGLIMKEGRKCFI